MSDNTNRELYKTTLSKNGTTFAYVPATERIRALREWPEYEGYRISTEYRIIEHKMLLGEQLIDNWRCVMQAFICDGEGSLVSTGTDSCPYFFTTAKEPTKLQEDGDFCAKAESGAIARALQNLGIGLPSQEDLAARDAGKGGNRNAIGNTKAPGAPFQPSQGVATPRTDDSRLIEQYTQRSVAELRANGGEIVEFAGKGNFQLKYNPDKKSYYWSNVDKSVSENRYIATTVTAI